MPSHAPPRYATPCHARKDEAKPSQERTKKNRKAMDTYIRTRRLEGRKEKRRTPQNAGVF
jgi:hypothetical protein